MKKSELKALIREVIEESFGTAAMAASNRDDEQRRKNAELDRKKAKNKPVQRPTPEELAAAKKKLAQLPDEDWGNYQRKEGTDTAIKEIAVNEPASNPSYKDVKVGDKYISKDIMRFGDTTWVYVSTVLELEPISKRFGKDDRIVSVKTESYDLQTGESKIVDNKKKIWVSQLLQGLV